MKMFNEALKVSGVTFIKAVLFYSACMDPHVDASETMFVFVGGVCGLRLFSMGHA